MPKKRLPTPDEAAVWLKLSASNARDLLSAADRLAADQLRGPAVTLAVLSFEEAVKTRALGAIVSAAAIGEKPGFSDVELAAIVYRSHRDRHTAGRHQHAARSLPNVYGKLLLGSTLTAEEAAALGGVQELTDSLDAKKQAGLYTDFDPDTVTWTRPADTDQADFNKIRALAGKFMAETERQIQLFEQSGSL